jgi:hypothetical protein
MYATAATPEMDVEVSPTTYVAIASDCKRVEIVSSSAKVSAIRGALATCGDKCHLVAVLKIVPQ